MKLIVGLGNPGKEYEKTRHNVGFMMLDEISQHFNTNFNKHKFNGIYTEIVYKGEKIILLKPQKFMNLSGEVISEFVKYFKINIDDILIIYDDMDIECGKIKIKSQGSNAGHNGLKNIEQHLNSKNYKRIKIGISRNNIINTKNYVVGKMSDEEFEKIMEIKNIIPNIIVDYLELSFSNLMNKYNIT